MKRYANKILPCWILCLFLVTHCEQNSEATLSDAKWKWGNDPEMARQMNTAYMESFRAGNLNEAIEPLNWLIENTPDLNESLYINGAKIYEGLVDKEADAKIKQIYMAKVMEMYDLRIRYFGDDANVLNRQLFPAYKYYKGDQSQYAWLYELGKRTFESNGDQFYDSNLMAYMDIVRRYKLTGGKISDQEVLEIHRNMSKIIEARKAAGIDPVRMDQIKGNIDTILKHTLI